MASSGEVTIRHLRWADFDDLRETYFHLYDERARGEPIGIHLFSERPSISNEAEWFLSHFRKALEGDAVVVVAERNGRVVGSCTIGHIGPAAPSEQSHVGELGILVDHAHRGAGVGTALLRQALLEARAKFEVVYLSVFSNNDGAQRLYRRFGFTVCGHLPRIVKRGNQYLDEERMVLDFSKDPPAGGPR